MPSARIIRVEMNSDEVILPGMSLGAIIQCRGNSMTNAKHPHEVQSYDLRMLRALRRITRAIALHSKQLAACSHITAPQLVCLHTIIASGPMTATAISREIHVSPSTVIGILDRLEEKGYIRRERGREDRRIVFVSATQEGVALAQSAPSPLQTTLADALNDLPELEQATMTLALERIVDLMERREPGVPATPAELSPILDVPGPDVPVEASLAV